MDLGRIFVYGAGKLGKSAACELALNQMRPEAFLVTDLKGNDKEIDGVPVVCIDDAEISESDTIIIAVSKDYIDEVKDAVSAHSIMCRIVDDLLEFLLNLRKEKWRSVIDGSVCAEDLDYKVERSYIGFGQINSKGSVCHFRALADKQVYTLPADTRLNLLEMFEQAYGDYNSVNDIEINKPVKKARVKALMACCHKDKLTKNHITDSYIVPIQVGKALTEQKICELTDDSGINISKKNGNYCECTALYWAWKNKWMPDLDYIGLCHYRRKIAISEEVLAMLDGSGIDIALTAPTYIADIKAHFIACTKNADDWEALKCAVRQARPDYMEAFEAFESQHMVCQCNISIMRRGIFDEYCEFLFGVLERMESICEKDSPRCDRYLGYVAECLTSVFAMKHKDKYKMAYGDMAVME